MILTCPACGTRYVVKDGAVPAGGRQVRCASCKHSWHQDPEDVGDEPGASETGLPQPAPMTHPAGEPRGKPPESRIADHAHPDDALGLAAAGNDPDAFPLPEPSTTAPLAQSTLDQQPPSTTSFGQESRSAPIGHDPSVEVTAPAASAGTGAWKDSDDDYSPFAPRVVERRRSRWPLYLLLALLAIAAIVAAIWFFAPAQLQQRLGVAAASTDSPLELHVEQSSRQELASGNQLLEVSGKVINPSDTPQRVPPLQAQLRSLDQKVVYRWTIPPPARTLAPGGSASFNSAELNIPAAAACLNVVLVGTEADLSKPCETPSQAATPAAG